jgi:hypothetical protein
MSNILSFGDNITRDFRALPEVSQHALALRGFAHLLGNEQASRVVSKIRSAVAAASPKGSDGKPRKTESVTKDEVKAFRETNGETIAQWERECRAEALRDLDEGKLGTRVAGPRLDPVEAEIAKLARAAVITTLKAHNLKVPKGDETITFLPGTPQEHTRTMAQMISNKIAKDGAKFKVEAEKIVAAQVRARKAAEAKAKETPSAGGAEELGL